MKNIFRSFAAQMEKDDLFDRVFYFYISFLVVVLSAIIGVTTFSTSSIGILGTFIIFASAIGFVIGLMSVYWSFLPDHGESHFLEDEIRDVARNWQNNLFFAFITLVVAVAAIPTVLVLRYLGVEGQASDEI